jgi:phytoene dehydrogenase-like protein
MIKKEYDSIEVGGRNDGLCLGAYLQRAGMEVAIFERRYEEGGCICTRETTAPGFMHNHAVYMEFIDSMPFYYDFELRRLGTRTIYPDAEFGIAFSRSRPSIFAARVSTLPEVPAPAWAGMPTR